MKERKKYKNRISEFERRKYKELQQKIQRECRKAKANYWNKQCSELEELDKKHSPKMYKKLKEVNNKRNATSTHTGIKSATGELLLEKTEILHRWEEYINELYEDERIDVHITNDETVSDITIDEIKEAIKRLPNDKTPGIDNIPAEFLKNLGEKGMELLCKLMNVIYKTGVLPDDFVENIFTVIPKVKYTQECDNFRTISLISHASKILLQLIKNRITPIIERNLSDNQLGFRKG